MATDFFLKLDTIKGDSLDSQHAGEIEVESFSWGTTNHTTIGSATGGAGAGKAQFERLLITARVSSASPLLAHLCASGQHVKNAVLTVRKAGGKQEDYYNVTFKTVFLTQYKSVGGSGTSGANLLPLDELTFLYGTYQIEYRPQMKDGSLAASVLTGWSQITNTKA
jgi:type VI secretion system secreted protein Hcp